jgi:protein-S-isoprenylcysteine O-methyltransferase Ste14
MAPLFAALRSIVYASVFIGLWGWVALQVRVYDSTIGLELPTAGRVVGAFLMALGAAVTITCVASFVARGRGTPAPFDPPTRFVVSGPYRWVRNPMYIGALALLVGFGLWHRSVSMLLFAGLLFLLVHAFVVFYEEPQLERRFGDSYDRYKKAVRRWSPRLPPQSGEGTGSESGESEGS